MKLLLALVGLGVLGWWIARSRQQKQFWDEPNYMQQIQILAPSEADAMPLPPIKPLKGERDRRRLLQTLRRVG